MSRQYWSETLAWATADGTAVSNTTSKTIVFPNITIPANLMADGRVLRLTAYGRHSTTGTPTLGFQVNWGGAAGTTLAASGQITCGTSVTAAMWKVDCLMQVRSNGATGTIFAVGQATIGDDATTLVSSASNSHGSDFMGQAGVATPAATTVDLTADTALSLTCSWGTASANNTLTGHVYVIEALN